MWVVSDPIAAWCDAHHVGHLAMHIGQAIQDEVGGLLVGLRPVQPVLTGELASRLESRMKLACCEVIWLDFGLCYYCYYYYYCCCYYSYSYSSS